MSIALSKFLAQAGVDSRRKVVELIEKGFVTVNGQKITKPATRINPDDKIFVRGKKVIQHELVYILFNKPANVVTTKSDEQGRKTVMEYLPKKYAQLMDPVGRLDQNSTGVLVFTNDGILAQHLLHPRYEIKKVYQVKLDRPLDSADNAKIIKGIQLTDGVVKVDRIESGFGNNSKEVIITLHSGKNRILRRLFKAVGYEVQKLDRISYAGLSKRGLRQGGWRFLTKKEISMLYKLVERKSEKK